MYTAKRLKIDDDGVARYKREKGTLDFKKLQVLDELYEAGLRFDFWQASSVDGVITIKTTLYGKDLTDDIKKKLDYVFGGGINNEF